MAYNDIQKQALQNVASNMPVRNQQVASQIAAGRALSTQQLAKSLTSAPDVGNMARASQQAAPAVVQQAGQKQVAAAQTAAQNAVSIGQQALQNQQQQAANALAVKKLQIDGVVSKNNARLAALSEDVKNKLLDQQLQFKKDEAGRTLFNERQLTDWAITKAKSTEDFKNYQQKSQQMHSRVMQVLQAAQQKILQQIDQQNKMDVQKIDQKARQELLELKSAADRAIRRQQERDAENAAMAGAAWGIVGLVGGLASK